MIPRSSNRFGYAPPWYMAMHRKENQRALLTAAFIFSIAVHMGLIVWLRYIHIGQVSAEELNDNRGIYKVQRAENDTFDLLPDPGPPAPVRQGAMVRESSERAGESVKAQSNSGPVNPIERPGPSRSASSKARAESAQPSNYGNLAAGISAADATQINPPNTEDNGGLDLVFVETPDNSGDAKRRSTSAPARNAFGKNDGPVGGVRYPEMGGTGGGTAPSTAKPPVPASLGGVPGKPRPVDPMPVMGVPDLTETLVPPTEAAMKEVERLDDDFDYTVSVFEKPGLEGWARVDVTPRRSLSRLKTMAKDVVYVVDISGSIGPDWAQEAVKGVSAALDSLNPGDRFNIVFFAERTRFFRSAGLAEADERNLAEARQFLRDAQAGGGTDVRQALTKLMVRDAAQDRVKDIVLISDGVPTVGTMDTRDVINLITRDNDLRTAIYCVGIGESQNVPLLEFLAYRNRGYCLYAKNEKQAVTVIADLASRIRYPIMRDVRVGYTGLSGGTLLPLVSRDYHQGQTASYFARIKEKGDVRMTFAGHNGVKRLEFNFARNLKDLPQGSPLLERYWAWWRLQALYNMILKDGETAPVRAQINALKKEYKFETLY
jgi:Mg-chelatase subunit ChlD